MFNVIVLSISSLVIINRSSSIREINFILGVDYLTKRLATFGD